MSDTFWLLLLFPVVWPFVARMIWRHRITWTEMGFNIGIIAVLMTGLWVGGRYQAADDVEIWNGEVVRPDVWRFSCPTNTGNPCRNSFSCNCQKFETCSGSGKDRTCTTTEICDTCYRYEWEQNWYARTTIGDFEISRIDDQGARTPPRWSAIVPNEPVSRAFPLTNWVKGASHSLFNDESRAAALYADQMPEYPGKIYDYYKIDRVLDSDRLLGDLKPWNQDLGRILRKLGPEKQANAVLVVTRVADPMYGRGLEAKWLGGKKNDVVVVIGAPEFPKIGWVHVFSWSRNDMVNVALRDRLLAGGTVERGQIILAMDQEIRAHFDRRPMSEFEYLKSEIEPPTWLLVVTALLAFVCSPIITWILYSNDITDDAHRPVEFFRRAARRR